MAVILINPNSTDAMTQSALETARATSPQIEFEGWTSIEGPPAVEGPEDGARAVPPLLKLVKTASDNGAEAIIIACFDDTGLAEAQEVARCPVIGIGQASYLLASMLSGQTAVVTTVQVAVPVIQSNIRAQGFSNRVDRVIAANVPVLTLATDPQEALSKFHRAVLQLPDENRNIILGCSGSVTIVQQLQAMLDKTVIDGVTASAKLVRALIDASDRPARNRGG